MIDLHTHILPSVDDGAKDLSESLEIGREAMRQGVTKIVTTPHYLEGEYELSFKELQDRVVALQEEFDREGIEIELLTGSEVYLTADLAKKAKDGKLTTINGTKYLLIEFSMRSMPSYVDDVLYDLNALGYKPIIAHPERYFEIMEDPNILYNWVEGGVLAQLNGGSLLGQFGTKVKETAEILVEHNLVQLIGSDLHSNRYRKECLEESYKALEGLIGDRHKKFLVNTENVVEGKDVEVNPILYKIKSGVFGRFKKALGF
ncbi:tyrosine-protein phosphatase [Halonatronum saccharophilum]|uniref:tyrosine-protein phosphatase n=1 Tax=Halonatronum saccharophilum TaxID=150060 RepID=UPI000486753B|nr:CpsB/CapC family capsule biosynthesis tyrosine phosphatase [Halonatronum saccharophilum]